MKILVIGAGVSGTVFAINRKMNHPEDKIVIFEHLDKSLKKILATGNGKCNIANTGNIIYNDSFASSIVNEYNYLKQKEFLEKLNIKTKEVNGLVYPISESALTVQNALLKTIDKYGIKIINNINIIDYKLIDNKINVLSNQGDFIFDKLVFATGGKSSPKLGSDGSIISLLEKHRYQIKEFQPGLCPVICKENTKILDGTRVKANVSLYKNNELVFSELGELLFRSHGLSGIVIFNASRIIATDVKAKYVIKVDLLPSISSNELNEFLTKNNQLTLLESYLHPNIVKYIVNMKIKDDEIVDVIKNLTFNFTQLSSFDNSQISVGGLLFSNLNKKLESNIEPNVYFVGELINVDAPCGGYNLMWAIASSLYTSNNL